MEVSLFELELKKAVLLSDLEQDPDRQDLLAQLGSVTLKISNLKKLELRNVVNVIED